MKKNNLSLLFIAVLVLFAGCCKDLPCPELTKEDKAWMPYKNGDTITFKNFENDSICKLVFSYYSDEPIFEVDGTMSCASRCVSIIYINALVLDGVNNRSFGYAVKKIETTTYVLAGGGIAGYVDTEKVSQYALFDLREAVLLDTITIANVMRNNVYVYSTKEEVKDIEEMYIKSGVGFLKLTYRTGEVFELID